MLIVQQDRRCFTDDTDLHRSCVRSDVRSRRVAGTKDERPRAESQSEATAAMPIGPAHKPKTDDTALLPAGQVFAMRDPRSAAGRKRSDSRPPLDFSKNHKIDRFEMIREIARGGMGQVFLARDTKLGRKVAIKFLLHDDPEFVQRFVVEARATARCTHENIVTIFEVGEHEGLPYMVLEYLEGKTLSDVLDRNPSLTQFTELMVSVVRALERAHEHGIVHRDLKPSNIFVTDRGVVKVLDFGVARMIDRANVFTQQVATAIEPTSFEFTEDHPSVTFTSNSLVGTLPYMSPEQWGADSVDHLSDIWAVGIMFWRALTTKHPAGTLAPEKLRARLLDLEIPLPSIATRDAAIPTELVAIIDRCLAKRKGPRYQTASELLADLQSFLAPRTAARTDDASPYRGLAAFGEADAKYFFGRSNEIRTALAQLEEWPLLAVIGPSGVGKSSFVHAGLVPAVRATGGNWQVRVLRPGRVPLQRLASILEDALQTGQVDNDLAAQLLESPGMFGDMLRKLGARKDQKVLVVVDQLEELFTLCDDDAARRLFLAALLAAADDPTSPVRVVLSMRADFLDRLAGHKQFLAELSRGLFFLTAPDHDNLRETLVRPAELAGYAFEDASTVEDMMQAATSRGALPLLSFAASRLWEARDRERKLLTVAAYNQMGGVGGAFARHADQVAAAVPLQSQILLRAIMTRLVTPEGTRAVVDHAELLSLAAEEEVERILDQLVRARLIHLHTDPDQGATVEIVHEMLITEWPTLKRWLEDSQALRGFMHELRQAARHWASHDKSADLVWRGTTAQEALANADRHVLDLSKVEQEFLAAVRLQVQRARRRKLLVFATIFGVLAVVIAGGTFFTIQLSQANADAREKGTAWQHAAQEAQAAKADLQQKLDIINEKEKARLAAEAEAKRFQDKAIEADKSVQMSKEELEKANEELKRSLAETQAEKQKAQDAAEEARKASADAQAAKAVAEAAAARDRARADKLEKESRSIVNHDLRVKPAAGSASGSDGAP
jgi:serine/threonine protein kinase